MIDHEYSFIFVHYPQWRNILATIESKFIEGEAHRDAGLERVAIFMAQKA
jgi:hypothetical protein